MIWFPFFLFSVLLIWREFHEFLKYMTVLFMIGYTQLEFMVVVKFSAFWFPIILYESASVCLLFLRYLDFRVVGWLSALYENKLASNIRSLFQFYSYN